VLKRALGVAGVALLLGNANHALAQEVSSEDLPLRKKTITADPYAATGLNTGGLRLYPSLEIGAGFTTNVRAAASNPKSDIALHLKPTLRFESDWSRHSWTGSATGDWLHYKNVGDLSTLAGGLETAFRLDVLRTTHADFSASYHLSNTGAGNGQLPGTAIGPRRDHNINFATGLTHDFGGLEGSIKTVLARSMYEDVALSGGGSENNQDRNYWAPSIALRAALLDQGAVFNPYGQITYAPRFHDQKLDRNGLKRDSQGLEVAAGVSINDGPFWEGDVALTYLLRSYADAGLKTSQAIGASGRLQWRPTELTALELTSNVSLGETSSATVSASRNWNVNLNITHALRDNLNLKAGLGFALQEAGGVYDKSTTATLGADWNLNPNMTAGITYQGLWFNSGTPASDYNDQRVMTSIVLKR
jgi:hypothetical protein